MPDTNLSSVQSRSRTPLATKANSPYSAVSQLVDLNHASKDELKSLPGISDAMARKIIAGRPYNSKAAIVTDGIVPVGIFFVIKNQIEVR